MAYDNLVYVGAGDEFRIDVYDLGGVLLRSIRRKHVRRTVTEADVAALRRRDLANALYEGDRRSVERRYRDIRPADLMPAHGSRIIVDQQDNLWVEEFRAPADSTFRWTVFDADGRFLGWVTMPTAFRPYDIGFDYVVGVWADEWDVEHLQVYDLIKPGATNLAPANPQ